MSCKRCNSWFLKINFCVWPVLILLPLGISRTLCFLPMPTQISLSLYLSLSLSIYLYFFLYFSHWKYLYSSLIFKPELPYSNNQNTNQHEKTESPYFKIFCVEYNCRVILSNTEKRFLTQLFPLFENKILTLFLI